MDHSQASSPLVQWGSVNGWQVRWSTGDAGAFHRDTPRPDTGPQVWIHKPLRPTIVLGSAQPDGLVRRAAAEADGFEVCRRRSGGGLVFIDPETDCWLDLIVPATSHLWDADIGRAFHWVGQRWAEVLAAPPLGLLPVITDRPITSTAGRIWCFADLGHGEVSVGGSKVVGLSQRRTRTWIRIQSMVLSRWPGEMLRQYVDVTAVTAKDPERFPDHNALDPALVAAGLPAGTPRTDPRDLAELFLGRIPEP